MLEQVHLFLNSVSFYAELLMSFKLFLLESNIFQWHGVSDNLMDLPLSVQTLTISLLQLHCFVVMRRSGNRPKKQGILNFIRKGRSLFQRHSFTYISVLMHMTSQIKNFVGNFDFFDTRNFSVIIPLASAT